MTNAIILREDDAILDVKRALNVIMELSKDVFIEGVDYGTIPGVEKPSLYQAGAQKLARAFQLRPAYTALTEIEDFDKPLFYYRYQCDLIHYPTGVIVGSGIGSANSREGKWGYRWVAEHQLPAHLDPTTLERRNGEISEFAFAIEKGETTGTYGKPADYWNRFREAIADGSARSIKRKAKSGKEMDAWAIGGVEYRIINPQIFDQINTILKMATKRSFVGAVLATTGASQLYTQDVEDMVMFSTTDAIVDSGDEPEWNAQSLNALIQKYVPHRFKDATEMARALGVEKWSDWNQGYHAAINALNDAVKASA
jgi:hypothetical protein